MKKVFFILTFFITVSSFGQIMDTLQTCLKSRPTFFFKFDSRYSYVSYEFVKVFGFKLGLDFKKRIRLGLGYHELEGPRVIDHFIKESGVVVDTVPAMLRTSYIGLSLEYVFFSQKKWEISMPVQIGYGTSRFEYHYEGTGFKLFRNPVSVFEPTIEGHYKIIPYIGVGTGLGYRFMILNNREIEEKFNSPIYILKIKVFLGDIYKAIFRKKQ